MLPKYLIDKAKIAAINFHPGPPEYPGSGCVNFALYDGVDYYGVTAHLMNERIDNGRIIKVLRFPILMEDDVQSLLSRSHQYLLTLFFDVISGIRKESDFVNKCISNSKNELWNGKARKVMN